MYLTKAEPADFIQIAKEVYGLWSAGLAKDAHRHLLWSAYHQPWAKRNHYRLVSKHKEAVVVSCKVIHLPLFWHRKHFKIIGLGAIYTSAAHREQGLATNLVKAMVNKATQDGIDGLLLFSDIDPKFYAKCGFIGLGNLDFEIDNNFYSLVDADLPERGIARADVANISVENRNVQAANGEAKFQFSSLSPLLEPDEIAEVIGCHNRWLARQPYGIVRSYDYFTFQMARHLFIAIHSKNNKPRPCFTVLKHKQSVVGYAISERSPDSLRILEVIGSDSARAQLWQELIKQAKQMGLKRTSGFESVSRDFIPYQRFERDKLAIEPSIKPSHIRGQERSWGQPMFLPINSELVKLSEYNPCPLLEFDYF